MMNEMSLEGLDTKLENVTKATAMLKMLANENRLLCLCHLIEKPMSVGTLVDTVGISQSAMSQHLAKLRQQGLVAAEHRGQEVYYQIVSAEAKAIIKTLHELYCA